MELADARGDELRPVGTPDFAFRLLVFRIDEHRFALPLERTERVVQAVAITPLPAAPEPVAGIVDIGGRILPVMDVRRRYGLAACPVALEDVFVIARTAHRSVVLWTGPVLGAVTVAAENRLALADADARDAVASGVARLRDGLVLIHDLDRFLAPGAEVALRVALAAREVT